MKRLSKIFLAIVVFSISVINCVPAYAENDDDFFENAYSSTYYDYYISNYDVKMDVQEDNKINVEETIDAFFGVEKHGIYRYLPISGTVEREDGSSSKIHAKISNIKVNDELFDTYEENSNLVLQIGSENKTLSGEKQYVISYTYDLGIDANDGFDELYFNIIGDGWDTYIEKVSFSINMPKEFDKNKIGFSAGGYGTIGNDNTVEYTVDGNTITGTVKNGLNSYEALTTRIELPDGYFAFDYLTYYVELASILAVPMLAFIIVLVIWKKYGKDKKVVKVVEFYPPENMNCAEVSYWHNGVVTAQDTVPLMIELANEGYLKIEEYETEGLLKHGTGYGGSKFGITKIKQYSGNDKYKKMFFDALFSLSRNGVVYETDLEESFYTTPQEIASNITLAEKTNVYDKKSLFLRVIGWGISILAGVISFVFFNSGYGTLKELACFAAGIAICIASLILACFIRRRTDRGHEMKQKIEGFKDFLEKAEKDKLEALVEQDPTYFYDILPFAYVLGVSDKWTKKFESIAMEPPSWYYGASVYRHAMMYHFMNSTMKHVSTSMTSTPQSSSSGSFGGGGGGFSGGGFGGGGGGSW